MGGGGFVVDCVDFCVVCVGLFWFVLCVGVGVVGGYLVWCCRYVCVFSIGGECLVLMK